MRPFYLHRSFGISLELHYWNHLLNACYLLLYRPGQWCLYAPAVASHAICFHVKNYTVDVVMIRLESVITELVPGNKKNYKGSADAYRKPQNINSAEDFVAC